MPLLRHVKFNRIMLKKSQPYQEVSLIKNVKYVFIIIFFFKKAMSQRYKNRKYLFIICFESS